MAVLLAILTGSLGNGHSTAAKAPDSAAGESGQSWNDRPSSSTDPVTFVIDGYPYQTPPKNPDCCKPLTLPDHAEEMRPVRYRVPRNFLTWMDDWSGGAQTLVRLKVTFPGFEPLKPETEQCLSQSPAFRPTRCVPLEIIVRTAGSYEPADDVKFENWRDLFHSQRALPAPDGFELYEIGPPEARINTYRKVTPLHTLLVQCFLPHAGPNQLATCDVHSRLDSGNLVSYRLYSDQLKDAEAMDEGVRRLVRSFQLE